MESYADSDTPKSRDRRCRPAIWTPLIILATATVLILVFSEIIPKTRGELHAPRLAGSGGSPRGSA